MCQGKLVAGSCTGHWGHSRSLDYSKGLLMGCGILPKGKEILLHYPVFCSTSVVLRSIGGILYYNFV